MTKKSAGILAYRFENARLELLLVHKSVQYFKKRNVDAGQVPKRSLQMKTHFEATHREFLEETCAAIHGIFRPLAPIWQKGGKTLYDWAQNT